MTIVLISVCILLICLFAVIYDVTNVLSDSNETLKTKIERKMVDIKSINDINFFYNKDDKQNNIYVLGQYKDSVLTELIKKIKKNKEKILFMTFEKHEDIYKIYEQLKKGNKTKTLVIDDYMVVNEEVYKKCLEIIRNSEKYNYTTIIANKCVNEEIFNSTKTHIFTTLYDNEKAIDRNDIKTINELLSKDTYPNKLYAIVEKA